MSWIPPTPPITPHVVRTAVQSGRLLGMSLLARVAAGAARMSVANVAQTSNARAAKQRQLTKKKKMKVKAPKISKAVAKYVKKAITRSAELKAISYGSTSAMTHNTVYGFNLTALVLQGTSDFTRVGDMITLRELVMNYHFAAPTTTGAFSYRVLVLWSGEENAQVNLSAASLTSAEVFQPTTATNTTYAAIPNPKAVTVLADHIVDINSNLGSTEEGYTGRIKVNLKNLKFAYQSNGSTFGKLKNLYCVVVGFTRGGTAGSTSVGNCFINYDMRYAD